MRVKEVLERGFADFYDAFADMDADSDGKVSLDDFQTAVKMLEGGDDLTSDQIDSAFNRCGVDADGLIVYKDFHAAFMGKAVRTATDAGGITSSIIPRAFEEVRAGLCTLCFCVAWLHAWWPCAAVPACALLCVASSECCVLVFQVLMECKDAQGVQKFVTVPSTMNWNELLQKLKHKYGRPVIFMYEADSHTYTVKDDREFKQCWDSVEEAFLKINPVTPSAHLQAFIIDVDPTKLAASTRAGGLRAGRKSHLAPKRVTLGEAHDDGNANVEGAARRQAQQQDFDKQHQQLDELMRKVGVGESEPQNMRKKWEKLIKECAALDTRRANTVPIENFKKALLKVDPSMTADQVQWFVNDADKNSSNCVLYEKYCTLKKTGKFVTEGEGMKDDHIKRYESEISKGFKDRYKSLQAAFKRLDEDKDGFVSKNEFRNGLENKLKMKVAPRILDEIFKRADLKNDGQLDYEEFLEYFRVIPDAVKMDGDGTVDSLTGLELCKLLMSQFGGIGEMFAELDSDGNGQVSREEFMDGIRKAGIKISRQRVTDLIVEINPLDTHAKNIDYRKFMAFAAKISQSDLHGSGTDDVAREEARVRDKIRENYPDAKQAFHAFNHNKDGRLSEEEFFKGIDLVFGPREQLPLALKNRLMKRADMDGDGYLAYHEFLGRYGVKPQMRRAMSLEKKISTALSQFFPDSLQKAFEAMDRNRDGRLDKEDLKAGIEKTLKLTMQEGDLNALLSKLGIDGEGSLDFQQFLVRFGLEFKAEGHWEYTLEKGKQDDQSVPEDVKLFRRSMYASKWFGRGGIKRVLLKFSIVGSMYGKWDKLKQKCAEANAKGKDAIPENMFQEMMKGPGGVEPNLTDQQWIDFRKNCLDKEENGFKASTGGVKYAKVCDKLAKENCSLVQLGLKEFGSALRDGLSMLSLSSDDVQVLSGKIAGKPWWSKGPPPGVDVDKFQTEFLDKFFQMDFTLFQVLLVDNVWLDVKRVFDSLNTHSAAAKTIISRNDFDTGLLRLVELNVITKENKLSIFNKVKADQLFEKEGTFKDHIDYMKNFLLHYITNEISLHNAVYPSWEDCAEKFARFVTNENAELNYREFRELCRQFTFSRDLSAMQLETLIDVMDVNGDGNISLEEFKLRYARDEAKIMDAVRENWNKIDKILQEGKKAGAARGRLDRPVFQQRLMQAKQQNLLPGVEEEQIVALVVSLEAKYIADKEIKYDEWLQKYAGDYFVIYQAFSAAHPTYRLPLWEVVVSCFEILESSRSIISTRMWRYLKAPPPPPEKGSKVTSPAKCPICDGVSCMWHKEFEAEDMVTWEEFRGALERAGIDLQPRLLTKLLDDLDPQMHGFVHWRAFVEGRIPKLKKIEGFEEAKSTDGKSPERVYRLSKPAEGPYFLGGLTHYRLRQVLVASWNRLLVKCTQTQKQYTKEAREKAQKEQKEFKPSREGTLDAKGFDAALLDVLKDENEPTLVTAGTGEAPLESQPKVKDPKELVKKAKANGEGAFSFTDPAAPTVKLIDYNAFCRNYSQGDFNAERYVERKWETIYMSLKQKDVKDSSFDGHANENEVKKALESPEMGLSKNMVSMLLKAHDVEFGEEDEDESEEGDTGHKVDYIELCWRFAKKNIQRIMFSKCLDVFHNARKVDKAQKKKLTGKEMQSVLRNPKIGFSECESELFIRKYIKSLLKESDTKSAKSYEDVELNYDQLLSGEWEEVPCNHKVSNTLHSCPIFKSNT